MSHGACIGPGPMCCTGLYLQIVSFVVKMEIHQKDMNNNGKKNTGTSAAVENCNFCTLVLPKSHYLK